MRDEERCVRAVRPLTRIGADVRLGLAGKEHRPWLRVLGARQPHLGGAPVQHVLARQRESLADAHAGVVEEGHQRPVAHEGQPTLTGIRQRLPRIVRDDADDLGIHRPLLIGLAALATAFVDAAAHAVVRDAGRQEVPQIQPVHQPSGSNQIGAGRARRGSGARPRVGVGFAQPAAEGCQRLLGEPVDRAGG